VRYNSIVQREEGSLIIQFGDDFKEYCSRVPRWRPRLVLPFDKPKRSWAKVLRREAVEVACCAAGALVLVTKDLRLAGWILGN
jgi:hypothetical protein